MHFCPANHFLEIFLENFKKNKTNMHPYASYNQKGGVGDDATL